MGQLPADGGRHCGSTASGVDVLDRAFAILFAFRPEDEPLTLAELAGRTGLYKSTLLRLAAALIHHRFLYRLEDGRYRLGSAPLNLGSIYQSSLNLGDSLLPLMRELNRDIGERDPETAGISAPVFGAGQSLMGALGIVGPVTRLGHAELEGLRPRLLATAARATELLGGNPQPLIAASLTMTAVVPARGSPR